MLIFGLLLSFMLSVVMIEFYPKDGMLPRANLHKIKKEAQKIELNELQVTHYRFIYVKIYLHVREEAYSKSEIIDTLPPGEIVILVQKEKAWSYVSYSDAITTETKHGWVFSRYLKKGAVPDNYFM